MTRKQLELREKAVRSKYIDNDLPSCVDAQMDLFRRMKQNFFFRYRPLKYYEIESLENETIFLRWPSTYEDEGDCTPVLDFEEVTDFIVKKNYLGFNIETLKNRLIKYGEIMTNPKMLKKINEMRDMWLVSCFTERYDNALMWNEYADCGKGICLSYNVKDILNAVKKYTMQRVQFMPVRYVADRNKCREMMINHRDLLEDIPGTEEKYLLACMTKNCLKYSFEEEWRLLLFKERSLEDREKGISVPFINPDMILCGPNIDTSCRDYKKMIDIAKRKNIEVVYLETK